MVGPYSLLFLIGDRGIELTIPLRACRLGHTRRDVRRPRSSRRCLVLVVVRERRIDRTTLARRHGSVLPPPAPRLHFLTVGSTTVALSALVTNSQLVIPPGRSKASLLGFYDCAMGEPKKLRIKYLFKGREHYVEVIDTAAVAAPLRGEWLLSWFLFSETAVWEPRG